ADYEKAVKLWDAGIGQELRTLKGHTSGVRSVAFSPDGKRVASADDDGSLKLWDTGTGQELRTLKGHTDRVNSVAFSQDGSWLASAGTDGTVKLWDARPLTPEVKAEVDALSLLETLFAKPLPKSDVLTAVRNQVIVTDAARKKALELAGRFREETDPQKY